MALQSQPSAAPTRKMLAVIIAGMIMGGIQTLLRTYWPDHPFAPLMGDLEIWLQAAVMVAAGYLTRERA